MALTPEEIKAVQELKRKGYTNSQVAGFIGGIRTGNNSTIQRDIVEGKEEPTQGRLAETFGDIKGFGQDVISSAKERSANVGRSQQGEQRGEQGKARTFLQTIGQGAGFASDVIGSGIKTVGKLFTSEETEQKVGSAIETGARKVAETDLAQNLLEKFENLPPEKQRDISASFGVVSLAAELAGLKGLGSVTKQATQKGAGVLRGTFDKAKNAIKLTDDSIPEVSAGLKGGSFVDEVLFPVPDNVLTSARRLEVPTIEKYIRQAQQAVGDTKVATPLELAGDRSTEALRTLQNKLNTVGANKSAILEKAKVGNEPLGNVALKARQDLNRAFNNAKLDSADQKLINTINDELVLLGRNPSVKQVDEFVDFAQDQLYKASDNLTIKVSDKVTGQLRKVTGQLNNAVKDAAGESYKKLNSEYASLIDLRNQLNKALGPRGDRGGSVMKRVFSPTDSGTKKMFAELERITGINLVDEATMAKFSMEMFGDNRQRSLLEQLNLSVDREIAQRIAKKLLGPTVEKGQAERLIDAAKAGKGQFR